MQSRLVTIAGKLNRIISSNREELFFGQRTIGLATSTGRTADPALHSEEPEEVGANEGISDVKRRHQLAEERTTEGEDPYISPKSPFESSPKIKNPGVSPHVEPVGQQKRRNSNQSAATEEVSCIGLDGSPWPEDECATSLEEQRREQDEDQREYFKHHKASPLSEIEVADTRKPVTQASDGTGGKDAFGYDQAGGVLVFKPEQQDSAEDSLSRATEIFKMNAMRGDPDSPHGKVLRELRGEYW